MFILVLKLASLATCFRVLIGLGLLCLFVSFILIKSCNVNLQPECTVKLEDYNKVLQELKNAESKNEQLYNNAVVLAKQYLNLTTAEKFIGQLYESLRVSSVEVRITESVRNAPNLNYELLRHRIYNNIIEMWNYLREEILLLGEEVFYDKEIKDILKLGAERKNSLLNDMKRLQESDGHQVWRQHEANHLSAIIQGHLHALQNPSNCFKARKLLCGIHKKCGYGCQLHHIVYCFIMAYATNRTLILESRNWYNNKQGWESVFQPLSETCLKTNILKYSSNVQDHIIWNNSTDGREISAPFIDMLKSRPSYLPLSIPKKFASSIKRFHGFPPVWWIGQFLKYILRPQRATQQMLKNNEEKLKWLKPMVGVHIRRTDKLVSEAKFHGIAEYMTHVDDYFQGLELYGEKVARNIYVATDDNTVIAEIQKFYPRYKVFSVNNLNAKNELERIILDIHILSRCDYLVCTFSSNVCRVAYEIMQTLHVDASKRYKSLDDIYYFGGQNDHHLQAIMPHKADKDKELNFEVNDLIQVSGNHWNGYFKGEHVATREIGLFPTFKVIDKIDEVDIPILSSP